MGLLSVWVGQEKYSCPWLVCVAVNVYGHKDMTATREAS